MVPAEQESQVHTLTHLLTTPQSWACQLPQACLLRPSLSVPSGRSITEGPREAWGPTAPPAAARSPGTNPGGLAAAPSHPPRALASLGRKSCPRRPAQPRSQPGTRVRASAAGTHCSPPRPAPRPSHHQCAARTSRANNKSNPEINGTRTHRTLWGPRSKLKNRTRTHRDALGLTEPSKVHRSSGSLSQDWSVQPWALPCAGPGPAGPSRRGRTLDPPGASAASDDVTFMLTASFPWG